VEDAVDGDRVHRHLGAVDVLLGDEAAVPGSRERGLDRRRQLRVGADEGEPALALPVGRLDDAGRRRHAEQARVRHPLRGEALALALLRGREHGGGSVDRVRQSHPLGDPRRDPDRPVRSRRDDAVDVLRTREPVDVLLVLGRDERALVGPAEPGRAGVAIDGDHVEVTLARRAEEPDLRRACA
jgi:hypothetical protein